MRHPVHACTIRNVTVAGIGPGGKVQWKEPRPIHRLNADFQHLKVVDEHHFDMDLSKYMWFPRTIFKLEYLRSSERFSRTSNDKSVSYHRPGDDPAD